MTQVQAREEIDFEINGSVSVDGTISDFTVYAYIGETWTEITRLLTEKQKREYQQKLRAEVEYE